MQQYMPKNIIKCFDIIFYCDIEIFAEFWFFECTVNEQASCKLEHNNVFLYKKTNYHFLLKNKSFWNFWTFHIEWAFWPLLFYVKLINCYTYVALIFFFTFFGGLRNIFGTLRWSKKWENEEFVEEVSETLIFILKKMGNIIVKICKQTKKCKQSINTFFGKVHYMVDHNHHMDKWSQYCHLM